MTPSLARFALPLACLLSLGAASCGGAGGGGEIRVRTEVHLVRGEAREPLGVDPERARTTAAAAALERAVGRPVAVEIDAALTPASAAALDTQTASSLEGLARYLSSIRSDELAADFVRRRLSRVVARYKASAEHRTAAFDDETGSLVFTLREASWGSWLPAPYGIDRALDEALVRELEARFSKTDPASVAPADIPAYYRLLTSRRAGRSGDASDRERAENLAALLRLEPRARGSPIHEDLEKRLADSVGFFVAPERQAPAFASARGAYARWVAERIYVMRAGARSTLYERLVGRSSSTEACTADPCPLPELDRVKLALGFFTQPAPADEKDFGAFDQALCLYVEKDGKAERNRSCASMYPFLLANDARADRLVAALAAAQRRELFVAALVEAGGRLPVLLAALERRGGSLYADAFRVALGVDHYRLRDQRRTLTEEATRLWRKRPDLRPVFLLAVLEGYVGRDDEAVARLGNELGPIDAATFGRFLDESPRSMELAPVLWPALGGVPAPFSIVAARLDAFVAKRGIDASKTVSALVRRACQRRDHEGLRSMRGALERRARGGDKDAAALALTARDCKAPLEL